LRRLRDQAGKQQQVAADVLGRSRTRIVQLEDGSATISHEDLTKLLDCYEVTGEERENVLELGARARNRQKRRSQAEQLPDSYRRYAELEASATEINNCENGIIPGLLQSPSYLRAIFSECEGIWWNDEEAVIEERIEFRLERQRRVFASLDRRFLRFLVTENAFRANMGTPQVMTEQLLHILELLDTHRDLTVRVMPDDAFGNPARGHSFTVFGFGDHGSLVGCSPAVVAPARYYDDEAETARLLRVFNRTWELALSRQQSRECIEDLLKE
jgi:transcriptional regulator with XRE-family HTH domain